jgi:hypothetical protein
MPVLTLSATLLTGALAAGPAGPFGTAEKEIGVQPRQLRLTSQIGLVRGIGSLASAWRPPPLPSLLPGLKTIAKASSVELQDTASGLALRAGNLFLPTNPDGGRPYYLVFDERPGNFLTAAAEHQMGVQANYSPLKALGFTLGAYNNKGSYKFGTLLVKDTLGRVDVDLGFARGGGFYYYGTGRWLGDRTKAGVDVRTRLGPIELSGQILHGVSYGVEQFGWYGAVSQNLTPTTTLVARLDQHNPNLRKYHAPESHVVFAVVQKLPGARTLKINVQAGLGDPNRAPIEFGPNNWALIGQLSQRF